MNPVLNYWPRNTRNWGIPEPSSQGRLAKLQNPAWHRGPPFSWCRRSSGMHNPEMRAKLHAPWLHPTPGLWCSKTRFPLDLAEFKTHLLIFPETSLSFMKHSMLRGRSVLLELISFFSFSHSWYRRSSARILDFASNLYLVLNSAQKWSTNFSSKFFPPKKGSKAVPST